METGKNGNDEHNELGGQSPYSFGAQHPMESGDSQQGEITPPYTGPAAESSEASAPPEPAAEVTPPAPAFGMQQFEGTEPHFEGEPPEEYIDATVGKFEDTMVGNIRAPGVFIKYKQFTDMEVEPVVDDDGRVNMRISEQIRLRHTTPEGVVDMLIRPREATLHCTGDNGVVTAQRYYLGWQQNEGPSGPYIVLRKGTSDAFADMVMQNPDPLVGVEETAWVTDEMVANGKPPAVSFGELSGAMLHDDETQPRLFPGDVMATATIFNGALAAHQAAHTSPDNFINADPEVVEERTTPEGIMIISSEVSAPPDDIPDDPSSAEGHVSIVHREQVDAAGIRTARERRGLLSADYDYVTPGTFEDQVQVMKAGNNLLCTHQVFLHTPDGVAIPLSTRTFTPTMDVIGKLRNLMLVNDEQQPRDS